MTTRFHLSFQWYETCDASLDNRVPRAICGAVDDDVILKRGRGAGLVPPGSWGIGDVHCKECIRKMMTDEAASE